MRTRALIAFCASTLDRRIGTIADYVAELQADGLVVKGDRGRYGGTDLSETDVVNTLLALTLDHPRGETVCAGVRRARGLFHDEPPLALPQDFTRGLSCFSAVTAGDMIENVIRDLRTRRFESWSAGERYEFNIGIFSDASSVFMDLKKEKLRDSDFRQAMQGFAKPGFAARRRYVERQITIGDRWFREIAEALNSPS